MAARHNACVNPALSVNATGWGGGSAPTRVTGLTGYNRTTGARYTSGGYLVTPTGTVAPSAVVTISLDLLTEVFDDTVVDLYFYVTRSSGGDVQVGAISTIGLTANVVARPSITRTCPALTTGAYLVVDGINMSISPAVATAVLIEVAGSAGTYFDGDSAGGSWDGTTGLSASTLSTGITQAINPAAETDTAQPLGRTKARSASPATSADTAQPLARSKTRSIGAAAETDTAQSIARAKACALGPALAAETAQPLGRRKTRALGVALETDVAIAITQPGQAGEHTVWQSDEPDLAWATAPPRVTWTAQEPDLAWTAAPPTGGDGA